MSELQFGREKKYIQIYKPNLSSQCFISYYMPDVIYFIGAITYFLKRQLHEAMKTHNNAH